MVAEFGGFIHILTYFNKVVLSSSDTSGVSKNSDIRKNVFQKKTQQLQNNAYRKNNPSRF
jgi:hypothetical protein